MKKMISIVVACYNEEESIPLFYKEIKKVENEMNYIDFEYIFVDDGSNDNTLTIIRNLSEKDKSVRYISFSRNFGKEGAMLAGLEASKGDYITVMDADLQDPPTLLPEMYNYIIKENYDCVGTRRVTRKGEPPIRSFFARCFYKLINKMSKVEMVDGARDYRLMTRQMVNSITNMKEYNRYSKGLFSFVGFKTKWLEYENIERAAGETKWSFWKLFKYAIEGILAFTTLPLSFSTFLGIIMCIISFALIIVVVIKNIITGNIINDYFFLICIIIFISGIQLFCMGIIGQYLAKAYLEIKKRPIYIIRETEKDNR